MGKFTLATTIKMVRDVFKKNSYEFKKRRDGLRIQKKVGKFDVVAAAFFYGESECKKLYATTMWNKTVSETSTWDRNIGANTNGRSYTCFLNDVSYSISDTDTLETVYNKMDSWNGWASICEKQDVLDLYKKIF